MEYKFACFKRHIFKSAALLLALSCASLFALPPQAAKAANLVVVGGGGGGGQGGTGYDTSTSISGNGAGGGGGGGGSGDGSNAVAGDPGTNGGLNNPSPGGGGSAGGGDGSASANDGNDGNMGGSTGTGGDGGAGAAGSNNADFVYASGTAGNGGSGTGGDGGDSIGTSNAASADNVHVIGGSGGGGGGLGGTGTGHSGGTGGNAVLSLRSSQFEASQSISVSTGRAGGNGGSTGTGGDAGSAKLLAEATTLYTPLLLVQRYSGASATGIAVVEAGTFAVGRNRLSEVELTDLTAADSVHFHTLRFDLGVLNDFSVLSNNTTDISFNALYVDGLGHDYLQNINTVSAGNGAAVNLSNKDMLFFIRKDTVNGSVMLTVNNLNNAGAGTDANLTGSSLRLNYCGAHEFYIGDTVALVKGTDAAGGLASGAVVEKNTTVYSARGDKFFITQDAYGLYATLTALTPALISYAEARAANHAFLSQGMDLVHNQGIAAAMNATRDRGFNVFAAGQGGKSRYETGSHVDVEGFNMLAGLAWGADLGIGRLTTGAFFEAGWGGYDSYNSFSNIPDVHGDGDMNYYGGGLMLRYDVTRGAASGLYAEASGRMGRSEMDFNTRDIIHTPAEFEVDFMYYGAHVGLGYVWSITDALTLDISGKALWTRQEGKNLDVHHEHVHFKDADSLRTRLGGRLSYAVSQNWKPYVGAYWEHEFDGESEMTVNRSRVGYLQDNPTLKGSTGVGEIGLSIKPGSAESGLSFDLGAQGYVGVRQGVSGSVQLKWEF